MCAVDEYLSLPCAESFSEAFFSDTVYIEFRICFYAKYENDIFSYSETSNELIYTVCISKVQFHQSGPA